MGWKGKYWYQNHYTGHAGYDNTGVAPSFEGRSKRLQFYNDWYFKRLTSGFPWNRFSAEWTGELLINHPGDYRFYTASDDGSKLTIDNSLVVDNWGLHGRRYRYGTISLNQGWHPIKAEFFENGGAASMRAKYRGPDTNNRWRYVQPYA